MKINEDLKKHIMENVLPSYEKNEAGHGISHINYVIERSFKFAKLVDDINYDMVYVIAAYHDFGIILMLRIMRRFQQKCYLLIKN